MTMIPVMATVDFAYQGQSVRVGDVLRVAPLNAAALVYQRKVRFTTHAESRRPEPEPSRVLMTRELSADSDPQLDETPDGNRQKRRYRRRDLTADAP